LTSAAGVLTLIVDIVRIDAVKTCVQLSDLLHPSNIHNDPVILDLLAFFIGSPLSAAYNTLLAGGIRNTMNSRFYYALPPDVATPDRLYRQNINSINLYADPFPTLYDQTTRGQYYSPSPNMYTSSPPVSRPQGSSTLPGGTMLHKGFYDLLALIPTTATTASRFLWGTPQEETLSGPRYEQLPAQANRPNPDLNIPKTVPPAQQSSPPAAPANNLKKGRRISKDMVSKPTGFVCVIRLF
jgi:hypothetical protein